MIITRHLCRAWIIAAAVGLIALFSCPADVLVSVNGERFVGKVVKEETDRVVFESDTAGLFIILRKNIRDLERGTDLDLNKTNSPVSQVSPPFSALSRPSADKSTNAINMSWLPPGVGIDGYDWIQLKSGEWLKGHLDYVQDKKVQFESDKLEDLTLKLKDVVQIYPGQPMYVKFDRRDQVYGKVQLSNDVVQVEGPETLRMQRGQLTGITPGGSHEIEFWSGKLTVGLNFQEGNTKQLTMDGSAELARRTPATQFLLNYLGNLSTIGGEQNANNHRVNMSYDVRLNRDWFVRPAQLEYYRDQLANIAHRVTAGVGVGYYFFDRDNLEWRVAAGPSYQYVRYEDVGPGHDDASSAPAASFQTRFKADITSRLTFIQSFTSTLTSESAGSYNHHAISTLEFEIKRYLDLDVSFVWDYLQNPQSESTGTVPQRSDLRLSVGIGAKF
jgi:hypothetical protein